MEQKAAPVQSIDRVIDLIESLAQNPRGLLLSELSALVGLPKSTVHRLLLSLSERGYVAKESATGKYMLTLRMLEVGSRAQGVLNIITITRPYLEHLSDVSGEIVHLVQREKNCVVYLSKIDASSSSIRTASAVGTRSAMFYTGVGKAILANLPPDEVRKLWDETPIQQFTPTTLTRWEDLAKELDRARVLGYAVDREEHEPGVSCVAAPIFNYSRQPQYAISISAPTARMDDQSILTYAPMLVNAAREISRFLGNAE